jgi:hypothetical protein
MGLFARQMGLIEIYHKKKTITPTTIIDMASTFRLLTDS